MRRPALAIQIQATAEAWAARIEAGEFDRLSPGLRCELRMLTLAMVGWTDMLDAAESPASQVGAPSQLRRTLVGPSATIRALLR